MLAIQLDGVEDLERAFTRELRNLGDGVGRALKRGIEEGVREAKSRHRYTDRTGKLTGDAFARVDMVTATRSEGVMMWPSKYASFVDGGTAPHEIVGNPFLTFQWKGEWVSFRRVQHPGTRPYAFAGDAYLTCERAMLREIKVVVQRMAMRFDQGGTGTVDEAA